MNVTRAARLAVVPMEMMTMVRVGRVVEDGTEVAVTVRELEGEMKLFGVLCGAGEVETDGAGSIDDDGGEVESADAKTNKSV